VVLFLLLHPWEWFDLGVRRIYRKIAEAGGTVAGLYYPAQGNGGSMRKFWARILTEEKGQAIVERAIIVGFFTIAILASTRFVVDGIVSYYSYLAGMVCLPIP